MSESDDCTSRTYQYTDSENPPIDSETINGVNQTYISFLPDGTLGKDVCDCDPFNWSNFKFTEDGEILWQGQTEYPTLIVYDKTTPRDNALPVFDPICGFNFPLLLDPNLPCENIGNQYLDQSNQNCELELSLIHI